MSYFVDHHRSNFSSARQFVSSSALNLTANDDSKSDAVFSPAVVSTPVDDTSIWDGSRGAFRSKSLTPDSARSRLLQSHSTSMFPSMIRVKFTDINNSDSTANRVRSLSMDSSVRQSGFVASPVQGPAELEISQNIPRGFVQEKLKAFGTSVNINRESPRYTSRISDALINGNIQHSTSTVESPPITPVRDQPITILSKSPRSSNDSEPINSKYHIYNSDLKLNIAPKVDVTTQTEILFVPNGQNTLVDRGNYKANLQILIAELDAAKDLNKKLSLQLAKSERDLQSRKIQQNLHKDKMDATVASRVADVVESLSSSQSNRSSSSFESREHKMIQTERYNVHERHSQTSITSDSLERVGADVIGDVGLTSAQLLEASSKSDLSPSSIQANCELMLRFMQEKGCQMPSSSGSEQETALELKAIKESIHQTNTERTQLTAKNEELRIQVEELQENLRKEKELSSSLQVRLVQVDSERQKLHNQCTHLKEDFNNERSIWKEQRDDLESKIDKLSQELDIVSTSLAKASANTHDLSEIQGQKRELTIQLEREASEKQELFLQLNTVIGQLADLELKSQSSDSAEKLRNEKDKIANELTNLYSNCQELQEKGAEIQQALLHTQTERDELKFSVEKLQNELKRNNEQMILVQNEKSTETLEKEISELKSEKEGVEKRRNFLEAEVGSLRRKVDELINDRDTLNQDKQELITKFESYQQSEEEKRDLENENLKLTNEVIELKQQLSVVKNSFEAISNEKDDLKIDQLSAENDRLSSELERIQMKMEQKEASSEHDLYEMRLKYRECDDEKFSLKEEMISLKRELDQLKSTPQIVESDEKTKPLSDENKKLKADLDKQQRLVVVLRRKLQTQGK